MLITEVSEEARRLADHMAGASPGELVTHAELSRVLGADIRKRRHLVQTARKIVQKETGASFSVERGRGYRRMLPDEAPATLGSNGRARIRSEARRSRTAITATIRHSNNLRDDVVRRANAEIAAFGLLEHIARDRTIKTVEREDTTPISVAEANRRLMDTIRASKAAKASAA